MEKESSRRRYESSSHLLKRATKTFSLPPFLSKDPSFPLPLPPFPGRNCEMVERFSKRERKDTEREMIGIQRTEIKEKRDHVTSFLP